MKTTVWLNKEDHDDDDNDDDDDDDNDDDDDDDYCDDDDDVAGIADQGFRKSKIGWELTKNGGHVQPQGL